MTVAKLKGARDRVRRQRGKCEGRKSYAECEGGPELVGLARQLYADTSGRSPSLRTVAAALATTRVRHTKWASVLSLCRRLDARVVKQQDLESYVDEWRGVLLRRRAGKVARP